MKTLELIDMSLTTADEANERIILACMDHLTDEHDIRHLTIRKAIILSNKTLSDEDRSQALHELALYAEDRMNEQPGLLAGTDDGQYWSICHD